VKAEDLTNEDLKQREIRKLAAYKKPNLARGLESVAILKARGFNCEKVDDAVDELGGLDRGEYATADEYRNAEWDLWSKVLDRLRELVDEDDFDGDADLPQLELDEQTSEQVDEQSPPAQNGSEDDSGTDDVKTASDLAAVLNLDGKTVRATLRKIAEKDDCPLYRVRNGSGYWWSAEELSAVAKRVAQEVEAFGTENRSRPSEVNRERFEPKKRH
jgi:hypothetical protein